MTIHFSTKSRNAGDKSWEPKMRKRIFVKLGFCFFEISYSSTCLNHSLRCIMMSIENNYSNMRLEISKYNIPTFLKLTLCLWYIFTCDLVKIFFSRGSLITKFKPPSVWIASSIYTGTIRAPPIYTPMEISRTANIVLPKFRPIPMSIQLIRLI